MAKAIQGLLGYHDFSAFQRTGSNRAHSFTTIQEVDLVSIEGLSDKHLSI